jgi:hypothetical protein
MKRFLDRLRLKKPAPAPDYTGDVIELPLPKPPVTVNDVQDSIMGMAHAGLAFQATCMSCMMAAWLPRD